MQKIFPLAKISSSWLIPVNEYKTGNIIGELYTVIRFQQKRWESAYLKNKSCRIGKKKAKQYYLVLNGYLTLNSSMYRCERLPILHEASLDPAAAHCLLLAVWCYQVNGWGYIKLLPSHLLKQWHQTYNIYHYQYLYISVISVLWKWNVVPC